MMFELQLLHRIPVTSCTNSNGIECIAVAICITKPTEMDFCVIEGIY